MENEGKDEYNEINKQVRKRRENEGKDEYNEINKQVRKRREKEEDEYNQIND
jgi:hypothetical protein